MDFLKTYQKYIASLVAFCFLTSLLIPPPQGLTQPALEKFPLSFVPVGIPPELASIEEVFIPDFKKEAVLPLIHIQSVHAHAETQKKIYSLLKLLNEKYGIEALYIEGAGEALNPDYFRFFDDNRLNVRVAEKLVEKGELTGAELFLIESQKKIPAYGLEDPALYRENLTSFQKVTMKREMTGRFTKETRSILDRLETLLLKPEARKLLRMSESFDAGQMELLSYALELERKAKEILGLDLRYFENQLDWPQMIRLLRLQELESKLEPEKIQSDREKLISYLKAARLDPSLVSGFENLAFSPFQSGMVYDPGFRKNDLPRYLAERLVEATPERGFSFEQYPYFTRYLEAAILQSELEGERLFHEMEGLFEALIQVVSSKEEERKLVGLVHEERLLERLFDLELTPKDYSKVMAGAADSGSRPLIRFLLGIESLYELTPHPPLSPKKFIPENIEALESLYSEALRFYELAKAREEVMAGKIFAPSPLSSPPQGERIKGEGGLTILITGGFHTEGLSREFRKKQIPYTILSPRITEKTSPEAYISSLLGEKKTAFDVQYLEAAVKLISRVIRQSMTSPQLMESEVELALESLFETARESKVAAEEVVYRVNKSLYAGDRRFQLQFDEDKTGVFILDSMNPKKPVPFRNINGKIIFVPVTTVRKEIPVFDVRSAPAPKRARGKISGESGGGVSSAAQRNKLRQRSTRSQLGQVQRGGKEILSSFSGTASDGVFDQWRTKSSPRPQAIPEQWVFPFYLSLFLSLGYTTMANTVKKTRFPAKAIFQAREKSLNSWVANAPVVSIWPYVIALLATKAHFLGNSESLLFGVPIFSVGMSLFQDNQIVNIIFTKIQSPTYRVSLPRAEVRNEEPMADGGWRIAENPAVSHWPFAISHSPIPRAEVRAMKDIFKKMISSPRVFLAGVILAAGLMGTGYFCYHQLTSPTASENSSKEATKILRQAGFEELGSGYFLKKNALLVRISGPEKNLSRQEIFVRVQHQWEGAPEVVAIDVDKLDFPGKDELGLKVTYSDNTYSLISLDRKQSHSNLIFEGDIYSQEALRSPTPLKDRLIHNGFREIANTGIFETPIKGKQGEKGMVVYRKEKVLFVGSQYFYGEDKKDPRIVGYEEEPRESLIIPGERRIVPTLFLRSGPLTYGVDSDGLYSFRSLDPSVETPLPLKDHQKERQGPDKEGFVMGGVNTNETIDKLTQLANMPIAQIEKNARLTEILGTDITAILGADENLKEVLKRDNAFVSEKGLTHQQLAEPLFYVKNITQYTKGNDFEFSYKGKKYKVQYRYTPFSLRDFESFSSPGTVYKVTNVETGAFLEFDEQFPYYIWRYGFYGGSTKKRVEPEVIIKVFPQVEKSIRSEVRSSSGDGTKPPSFWRSLAIALPVGIVLASLFMWAVFTFHHHRGEGKKIPAPEEKLQSRFTDEIESLAKIAEDQAKKLEERGEAVRRLGEIALSAKRERDDAALLRIIDIFWKRWEAMAEAQDKFVKAEQEEERKQAGARLGPELDLSTLFVMKAFVKIGMPEGLQAFKKAAEHPKSLIRIVGIHGLPEFAEQPGVIEVLKNIRDKDEELLLREEASAILKEIEKKQSKRSEVRSTQPSASLRTSALSDFRRRAEVRAIGKAEGERPRAEVREKGRKTFPASAVGLRPSTSAAEAAGRAEVRAINRDDIPEDIRKEIETSEQIIQRALGRDFMFQFSGFYFGKTGFYEVDVYAAKALRLVGRAVELVKSAKERFGDINLPEVREFNGQTVYTGRKFSLTGIIFYAEIDDDAWSYEYQDEEGATSIIPSGAYVWPLGGRLAVNLASGEEDKLISMIGQALSRRAEVREEGIPVSENVLLDKKGNYESTPYFIRVGELYYVKPEFRGRELGIGVPEKALVTERVIYFSDFKDSSNTTLLEFRMGAHTILTLLLMQKYKDQIKDRVVFDLGSASGVVTVTALRQGARKVIAVERDAGWKGLFEKTLEANLWLKGPKSKVEVYFKSFEEVMKDFAKDGFAILEGDFGPVFISDLPAKDTLTLFEKDLEPLRKKKDLTPLYLAAGISLKRKLAGDDAWKTAFHRVVRPIKQGFASYEPVLEGYVARDFEEGRALSVGFVMDTAPRPVRIGDEQAWHLYQANSIGRAERAEVRVISLNEKGWMSFQGKSPGKITILKIKKSSVDIEVSFSEAKIWVERSDEQGKVKKIFPHATTVSRVFSNLKAGDRILIGERRSVSIIPFKDDGTVGFFTAFPEGEPFTYHPGIKKEIREAISALDDSEKRPEALKKLRALADQDISLVAGALVWKLGTKIGSDVQTLILELVESHPDSVGLIGRPLLGALRNPKAQSQSEAILHKIIEDHPNPRALFGPLVGALGDPVRQPILQRLLLKAAKNRRTYSVTRLLVPALGNRERREPAFNLLRDIAAFSSSHRADVVHPSFSALIDPDRDSHRDDRELILRSLLVTIAYSDPDFVVRNYLQNYLERAKQKNENASVREREKVERAKKIANRILSEIPSRAEVRGKIDFTAAYEQAYARVKEILEKEFKGKIELKEAVQIYFETVQIYGKGRYQNEEPVQFFKGSSWPDLLNNQLTPVTGFLDPSMKEFLEEEEVRESLERGKKAAFSLRLLKETVDSGDASLIRQIGDLWTEIKASPRAEVRAEKRREGRGKRIEELPDSSASPALTSFLLPGDKVASRAEARKAPTAPRAESLVAAKGGFTRAEVRAVYPKPVPHDQRLGTPTSFLLRYPHELEYAKKEILPPIFKKPGVKKLKVFFAGANTGEEVPSFFYALVETLRSQRKMKDLHNLQLKLVVNDLYQEVVKKAQDRLAGRDAFVYDERNFKGPMHDFFSSRSFSYSPETIQKIVQTLERHQKVLEDSLKFLRGSAFSRKVQQEMADSDIIFMNAVPLPGKKRLRGLQRYWESQPRRPIIFTSKRELLDGLRGYEIEALGNLPKPFASYVAIPEPAPRAEVRSGMGIRQEDILEVVFKGDKSQEKKAGQIADALALEISRFFRKAFDSDVDEDKGGEIQRGDLNIHLPLDGKFYDFKAVLSKWGDGSGYNSSLIYYPMGFPEPEHTMEWTILYQKQVPLEPFPVFYLAPPFVIKDGKGRPRTVEEEVVRLDPRYKLYAWLSQGEGIREKNHLEPVEMEVHNGVTKAHFNPKEAVARARQSNEILKVTLVALSEEEVKNWGGVEAMAERIRHLDKVRGYINQGNENFWPHRGIYWAKNTAELEGSPSAKWPEYEVILYDPSRAEVRAGKQAEGRGWRAEVREESKNTFLASAVGLQSSAPPSLRAEVRSQHVKVLELLLEFAKRKLGVEPNEILKGSVLNVGLESVGFGSLEEENIVTFLREDLEKEKENRAYPEVTKVTGLDLQVAADLKKGYVQGDVQKMPDDWTDKFDTSVIIGLFNPEQVAELVKNNQAQSASEFFQKSAGELGRVLKDQGKLLVSLGTKLATTESGKPAVKAFEQAFEKAGFEVISLSDNAYLYSLTNQKVPSAPPESLSQVRPRAEVRIEASERPPIERLYQERDARYFEAIRRLYFTMEEPAVVVPFSGSDVSSILLLTNAAKALWIDELPFGEKATPLSDKDREEYFKMKKESTWTTGVFLKDKARNLRTFVEEELSRIKAQEIKIIQNPKDPSIYHVHFKWGYPGEGLKEREFIFVEEKKVQDINKEDLAHWSRLISPLQFDGMIIKAGGYYSGVSLTLTKVDPILAGLMEKLQPYLKQGGHVLMDVPLNTIRKDHFLAPVQTPPELLKLEEEKAQFGWGRAFSDALPGIKDRAFIYQVKAARAEVRASEPVQKIVVPDLLVNIEDPEWWESFRTFVSGITEPHFRKFESVYKKSAIGREDLIQELASAVARAYREKEKGNPNFIDRYRSGKGEFKPWFSTVLKNRLIGFERREANRQNLQAKHFYDEFKRLQGSNGAESSESEVVENKELYVKALKEMANLKSKHQQIIRETILNERKETLAKTAARLKMTLEQLKSGRRAALEELKKRLIQTKESPKTGKPGQQTYYPGDEAFKALLIKHRGSPKAIREELENGGRRVSRQTLSKWIKRHGFAELDRELKTPRAEVRKEKKDASIAALLPGREKIRSRNLRAETRFVTKAGVVESGPLPRNFRAVSFPMMTPEGPLAPLLALPEFQRAFQGRDLMASLAVTEEVMRGLIDVLLVEEHPVVAKAFLEALKLRLEELKSPQSRAEGILGQAFSANSREGIKVLKDAAEPGASVFILNHIPAREELVARFLPALLYKNVFIKVVLTPGTLDSKQLPGLRSLFKEVTRKLIPEERVEILAPRSWDKFSEALSHLGERLEGQAEEKGLKAKAEQVKERLVFSVEEKLLRENSLLKEALEKAAGKLVLHDAAPGSAALAFAESLLASRFSQEALSVFERRIFQEDKRDIRRRTYRIRKEDLGEFVTLALLAQTLENIQEILTAA